MDFIHSAILGLVEGLTEFVPISSSGHLIVARKLMGLPLSGSLSFDAIIQLAAGLAVVCYFWRDILNIIIALFAWISKKPADEKYQNLILPIIIGTIPAIILGLLLQKYMDTVFRGTWIVAVSLFAGSILFYFAERKFNRFKTETQGKSSPLNGVSNRSEELPYVSVKRGFWIGCFQCLALVPGFSRSGATISGGLLLGLNRETAIRFSFLLSLPVILGSGLLKFLEIIKSGGLAAQGSSIFWASLSAFLSGLFAIHFLIKFLKNHSLNYFGVYRIILAIIILIWLK